MQKQKKQNNKKVMVVRKPSPPNTKGAKSFAKPLVKGRKPIKVAIPPKSKKQDIKGKSTGHKTTTIVRRTNPLENETVQKPRMPKWKAEYLAAKNELVRFKVRYAALRKSMIALQNKYGQMISDSINLAVFQNTGLSFLTSVAEGLQKIDAQIQEYLKGIIKKENTDA